MTAESVEPRIVTPEEAQAALFNAAQFVTDLEFMLLRTVATENERRDEYTRAAVVEALRRASIEASDIWNVKPYPCMWLATRADAIENGEDW